MGSMAPCLPPLGTATVPLDPAEKGGGAKSLPIRPAMLTMLPLFQLLDPPVSPARWTVVIDHHHHHRRYQTETCKLLGVVRCSYGVHRSSNVTELN